MSARVEVFVPQWTAAFGVHRLTEAELAELIKIRDPRTFTDRLLTLSVRFWRDKVRVWSDDWTDHNARIQAPSAYPAEHLEPLLTAALAINELTMPTEGDASATSTRRHKGSHP